MAGGEGGKVRGARVLSVTEGSPAVQLGLAVDDVITKIDGGVVGAPEDVFAMARMKTAAFRVEINRAGQPAYVDAMP